ncbi:MAG: site-specific DNA-methyltransferase [Dehalococcoidia bacterium]|nr:MAG: site-specific DNA-methyltransferase [Dehalococcoidia bacterium]
MTEGLDTRYKPVVLQGDCLKYFETDSVHDVHLTFFDPPYNQGKDYEYFNDKQDPEKYWTWITKVLRGVYDATAEGGAIYFMQREKNVEYVLNSLRKTGWTYQNLIIWRKMTSAIPCGYRFGKKYQVIAFATKGRKPRVFNKLRIDPPLPPHYKYNRENGMFVTDVWADIRELTSGYFAGDEAFKDMEGQRVHKQQSPVALLARIILSSSLPGDTVFDPMAGTGVTLVAAYQLRRKPIGIEIDPTYVNLIKRRLEFIRPADDVSKYYNDYENTPNLDYIWGTKSNEKQKVLF